MLLFFLDIDPYPPFGTIVAAILFVGTLVKAVHDIRKEGWEPFRDRWIQPARARRKRQDEMFAKFETFQLTCDKMGGQISEVLREVKPNGGESLKDRIINIDNKVENIVACKRHEDETSDRAIFKLDKTGQLTFANSAFRELVNAEDEQLAHNNYLSLMDEDDRRRFVRTRQEAIDYMMPLDAIVRFKLQGPHFRTIRLQASPDVRHGGELKGFFGSASFIDPPPPRSTV